MKTEHLFPNRQFARQRWAFRKILEVIKLVIGIILKIKKNSFFVKELLVGHPSAVQYVSS